jgi:hypothetical protein
LEIITTIFNNMADVLKHVVWHISCHGAQKIV